MGAESSFGALQGRPLKGRVKARRSGTKAAVVLVKYDVAVAGRSSEPMLLDGDVQGALVPCVTDVETLVGVSGPVESAPASGHTATRLTAAKANKRSRIERFPIVMPPLPLPYA